MTFLLDLRHALRQLKLAPMFTATVVLTLGLGIGACTAIFSLIDAVMLKSLPVADPSRLYQIGTGKPCCLLNNMQGDWDLYSFKLYKRLAQSALPEFEQVAAFQAQPGVVSVRYGHDRDQARALMGEYVSGNYFQTLGVNAVVGRMLTPDDDRRGAPAVAVMSYRTWQQNYGADPKIVGATFQIEQFPFTVVGIAPPGFFGDTLTSNPMDLWVPLSTEYLTDAEAPYSDVPSMAWLRMIGRLKPGATTAGVSERLSADLQHWLTTDGAVAPQFQAQLKDQLSRQMIHLGPGGQGIGEMRDSYRSSLRILLAICAAVLLIGCANVANLLLARGMARRPQTALQRALGASSGRILRQSFTESLLLSVMGGALGVAIAWAGAGLIVQLAFRHAVVVPVHVSPSLPVLGFCLALSIITGLIAGMVPAWLASRTDPMVSMRGASRTMGGGAGLPQKTLVVLQTALSLSLVAMAGMLTHSIYNLRNQDFGFDAKNREIVTIEPPLAKYTVADLNRLYRALQIRLEALPGVRSASMALDTPMLGRWMDVVVKPGEGVPPNDTSLQVQYNRVGPEYFETIGQPLVEGRGILLSDKEDTRHVAVVNQAFVRRFFPEGNVIGRHFGFALPAYSDSFEIVGVARDAKYSDPALPAGPMVFGALSQSIDYTDAALKENEKWAHFINGAQLWISGDMRRLEPQIRQAFAEVDPNFAIIDMHPLQQQVDVHYDQQRTVAELSTLFGALAILLASIGLYGVMAYAVARRTVEIGVRMAVGANRLHVILLVLRSAFAQVAVGLALGLALSFAAGRMLHSSLYQVGEIDLTALIIATSALLLSALIASLIPAQRAASVEPVQALRAD
ncbi:ABC transporter permease [Silvibacterium acidisoli]|uniref:ABC transporter permease n=1 Tax=Acidobacteriaceae bacterium ZG23-2 TaxID=2883246 RepID=UPI00406D0899